MAPGKAVAGRESYKISKYDAYSQQGGRTFVPFVAGVAEMTRHKFTLYNVVGGFIWVVGLTLAGYLFGNLPFVQTHLSKIIWALIVVPGFIALYGAWRARKAG